MALQVTETPIRKCTALPQAVLILGKGSDEQGGPLLVKYGQGLRKKQIANYTIGNPQPLLERDSAHPKLILSAENLSQK